MPTINTPSFDLACYIQGDEKAERLALVLPGLLDTKDYPHMKSHVDLLAELGYFAISFDMPGTWESGNDINQYLTTNSLLAVRELIAKYNQPTTLIGHSNGGRLALLASVRNPEVEACVAIMNAPTFVRSSNYHERKVVWKAEGINTSFRDNPANPDEQRQFDLPYSFCEDADKYDTRIGIEKLYIPKLFIAGNQDGTVTVADVRESFDAAIEPKQMVVLDSDHNYRKHPDKIAEVNELVKTFLTT